MTTPTPSPRPKRRLLLRLVLAAGVGVIALLAAVPLLVRSDRVMAQVRDRVLPKVSAELGREVRVAEIAVDLFPRVEITLGGLEVDGGPGEPLLAKAERGVAYPKLWPLIRSLGRDVQIEGLVVENAELAVVKRPNGEWSYEDLGSATEPPGGAPTDGVAPASPSAEVAWVLSNFELKDADLRMLDRSAGGERELRLPSFSMKAAEVGYERPLVAQFTGKLGGREENLSGELRLDRLPASFDGLPPEAWPKLSGAMTMKNVPLSVARDYLPSGFSDLVTGGALAGEAKFSSAPDGSWVIAGPVRIDQLSLRGQPANGSANVSAAFPPWNPDAFTARVEKLALKGPGVDLGGSASAAGTPMKVRFDLVGNLLDVDALLAALPADEASAKGNASAPAGAQRGTGGSGPEEPLVSESARESLHSVAATGTLKIARIVRGKLEAKDLDASATLKGGVLTLDKATASLFGGRLDAGGTQIDVRPAVPKWALAAGLDGVDLGAAMAAVGGAAAVQGLARGKLTLTGEGNDWAQLIQTVVGQGQFVLAEGGLPGVDLAEKIAAAIPGGKLAAVAERAGQGTLLRDLKASFQVKDGWLLLTKPLTVDTRFGSATLGGRIGLDQRLDLKGEAKVAPEYVAKLTGGRLAPKNAVPIPMNLGGTLKAPSVGTGAPATAIKEVVEDKVRNRVEEELRNRARRVIPNWRP